MNRFTHLASYVLLLTASGWFAAPASAAALIVTQPPCTPVEGFCASFTHATAIPTVRSFSFNAPSKGTAMVTFHGSMTCTFGANATILESQILSQANFTPSRLGPSGLQHKAQHIDPNNLDIQVSFNLASTRVYTIPAAGTQNYFFKIKKVLMITGFCTVDNAAFTVVFLP